MRSRLEDALTTGVVPLEGDAGVVIAVLVVERLPVGVEVTGTSVVVTTVVGVVTGVVDGVPEGVSVVVMIVGGNVVLTGVVVVTAVVVELSFLL